jgi:SOS-response transcriptional repressor LexA
MTLFDPMTEPHVRLMIAREKAGYATAADAARALGVKEPTYYSHENGSSGLRASVAEKYARKFKVSLTWLLTGQGEISPNGAVPYEIEVAGLPLLGTIQAGHWLETTDAIEGANKEMVPVVRDPRFPHAKQYALRVVGDSMDLDYPDGSIVTCVDFADSGLALAEGMLLHVERQRAGGQLIEITLKAVERRRGNVFLVPHSSNPKHQAFSLNGSDSDTEVVARGVVIGGYSPRVLPTAKR